jgi:hypothetical protein
MIERIQGSTVSECQQRQIITAYCHPYASLALLLYICFGFIICFNLLFSYNVLNLRFSSFTVVPHMIRFAHSFVSPWRLDLFVCFAIHACSTKRKQITKSKATIISCLFGLKKASKIITLQYSHGTARPTHATTCHPAGTWLRYEIY